MDRGRLVAIGKYALALGLLGVVVGLSWDPPGGRGLKDVWHAHAVEGRPVDVGLLAAAAGLLCVCVLAGETRWYVLVRAQGLAVSYRTALRLGWIGFAFNALLPGAVGGDVVKAAALGREQKRRGAALATVVMDRAVGLWCLFLIVAAAGGAAWAAGEAPGGPARVIVLTAAAVVGASLPVLAALRLVSPRRVERLIWWVAARPAVGRPAASLLTAALLYRERAGHLAAAVALTAVSQLFGTGVFVCCVTAFAGGDPTNPLPSPAAHVLIAPVAQLAAAVPLFPGGAGLGEAGYGGLYAWFGSAPANGVLGSLVQRGVTLAVGGTGLLACLALRPRKPAAGAGRAAVRAAA